MDGIDSQSTHFCLFLSHQIQPIPAYIPLLLCMCVCMRSSEYASGHTGFKRVCDHVCILLCRCTLMYVLVCIYLYACVCVCVCASQSTQRPSQSPLAGRERVQRSNEGVISLAGRLLHYQLMDSQPSALTGSTGYSFPPRSECATGDVFPLCVEALGVAELLLLCGSTPPVCLSGSLSHSQYFNSFSLAFSFFSYPLLSLCCA